MTGSEQRIDDLASLVNIASPDIDPTGIREWYWIGVEPQIFFESPLTNNWIIYIAENSGDAGDKQYPLVPGASITLDFSRFVKAKNIFFVTWSASDTLSIIVR